MEDLGIEPNSPISKVSALPIRMHYLSGLGINKDQRTVLWCRLAGKNQSNSEYLGDVKAKDEEESYSGGT